MMKTVSRFVLLSSEGPLTWSWLMGGSCYCTLKPLEAWMLLAVPLEGGA